MRTKKKETIRQALAYLLMETRRVEGMDTDKQILADARGGDGEAFRRVVEAYQTLVFNLAYRLTYNHAAAEDLAQECFLKLYRNFNRYDLSLPFKPWLVRIAINTGLSWLRRQKRHASSPWSQETVELQTQVETGPTAPGGLGDPARLAESEEMRQTVRRAVAALPPGYKAVTALRYFEGMDYETIGRTMEIPTGTVRVRLHRAREMLRRKLTHMAEMQ
jgi:RNA polymerase sigma-70 factor (ECF subfamily)